MKETHAQSAQQLIATIFEPLNTLDKSLPERITQYVLQGDEANVLSDLEQLCQTSDNAYKLFELLYRPCDFYGTSFYDKPKPPKKARIDFYQRWTDDYTLEQIRRFGCVLSAICYHLHLVKLINQQLPAWFLYLLYDGLISTMPSFCKNEEDIEQRKSWSIEQLHQLLEMEQTGLGEKLLLAIFDRQNMTSNDLSDFQYFYNIDGLLSYIKNHLKLFSQLPDQDIAVLGQVEQLKYIKKHSELQLPLIEFITQQALHTAKQVSQLATDMLMGFPVEDVQPKLQHFLTSGSVKQRSNAAQLLARISSDSAILHQALASETNKTVIGSIESALLRLETANNAKQQTNLVIPSFEPIIDIDLPSMAQDILRQNYQDYHKLKHNESYDTLTEKNLDDIYHYLNGKIQYTTLLQGINKNVDYHFLLTKNRLQNLPEFTLYHLFRAMRLIDQNGGTYCFERVYIKNDVVKNFDLRQIADVMAKIDYCQDVLYAVALPFLTSETYHPFYENQPDKLWPFFAEHEFLLDEVLGFAESNKCWSYIKLDKVSAIKILQLFPSLPTKYVNYLFELALKENKLIRHAAQNTLKVIPNIHDQVEQALLSPKQEERIAAADWLALLGQKSSIKALHHALKKEKREIIQASLLIALEKCGEDISQQLTTEKLLAEAKQGLKGKKPNEFDWFDISLMPALTWQSGEAVEPQIIQWWTWLAVKLKEPVNPLLTIYSQLLSKPSQQQLAEFILRSFIKQDTLRPSINEAEAQANLMANQRLQEYLGYYKQYPSLYPAYANITLEQVFEQIKKETLATYLGSAIKAKGVLALTTGIEGRIAVSLLLDFMKHHQKRRAQIEAMLEPLAQSDDPLITQLLLSIARRHRMATIQEKARSLVETIAERNGWTLDELADRTISTAGLDESGVLTLDYGERTFSATLDDKFKWHLKNADGDEIKALPEARKSEDSALVKDAKKQFSNSKKELTQLLDMQINRFYEAMCTQRRWRVDDWQTYLQPHPIVGRLIQRLVWLELDENGNIVNSFRPTEDGSLVNNQDDEIVLNENNHITVAHSALLTADITAHWQTHLKDYKIIQLFDQFNHPLPDIRHFKDDMIDKCYGWLTDSFTIRKILTKLGYKRNDIQDAGYFDSYYKYFASLKLYINIEFSGSFVPEENIPAALFNLYFSKNTTFKDRLIALDELPPVLLAEGYADYMAVADASSGFDPNWQDKLIW